MALKTRVALSFGDATSEKRRDPYREALRIAGVDFVENPGSLSELSGLVLTGGTDVGPSLYGQTAAMETDQPDDERDQRESWMVQEALRRDLPILGICRGLQFLNIERGGTLSQHVEGHTIKNVPDAHCIHIEPGTQLASLLGSGVYLVNSRHHQTVARLGEGLRVTATAPDGVIEALELPEKSFVLAVQWHPEERLDTCDRKLFEAFAAALAKQLV